MDNNKNQNLKVKEMDKSTDENEDIKKLIDEFNNLDLYDPKRDVIFKTIFGSPNEEIARSLLNAVLPHEKNIKEISFKKNEVEYALFNKNERNIVNTLQLLNENDKIHYLLNMYVHEEKNFLFNVEYGVFNKMMRNNIALAKSKKIYSINFIYFDIFDNEKFYHRLISGECEGTKNINKFLMDSSKNETGGLELPERQSYHSRKEIIIIELKKFKKRLNQEAIKNLEALSDKIEHIRKEIEEKQNNENKTKKEIEIIANMKKNVENYEKTLKLQLWLAFLAKINMVYEKNPGYSSANKEFDNNANEIKNKEYIMKGRKEFTIELYRLFKKYNEFMKALEICKVPLGDIKKNELMKPEDVEHTEKKQGKENKRQNDEMEEMDSENKKQKLEKKEN